jgi:hypothetical protein
MKFADLHLHTQFSDGTFTPEELVLHAQKAGLACIALTDHDTVEGCARAAAACAAVKMEFIPGSELTSEQADIEVHVQAIKRCSTALRSSKPSGISASMKWSRR